MPIVSSVLRLGHIQRGTESSLRHVPDRRTVTEIHTDHTGAVHTIEYLSGEADDRAAIMAARAVVLNSQLIEREIERVLRVLPLPLVLSHATRTQVATALRAEFLTSRKERTWELADWIMDGLDAGEWTDTQLRNVWNLTANQWNTLKAKLETYRTRWNEMQAAIGE